MKKLISVLAALFTVAVMLPCCANAATTVAGDGKTWELNSDGVLSVSSWTTTGLTLDTQPWADYRDQILEVEIGSGANGISSYAFAECKNLAKVTVNLSGYTLRHNAFENCESLTDFDFSNVKKLRGSAFAGSGLEFVELPEGINFEGWVSQFENCKNLLVVELPDDLTIIPQAMFRGCTSLEDITIPDTVTEIGHAAFQGSGLKSIVIPEGVEKLDYAFRECKYLESVTLPSTLKEIKSNTFRLCNSLKSIELPDGLETIGESAFSCSPVSGTPYFDEYTYDGLESVVIPESVTSIGKSVFSNVRNLTSIVLPKELSTVPYGICNGCNALKNVVLPEAPTAIEDEAFAYCYPITEFIIPETVTSIGASAIRGTKIESLIIPEGVTSIGRKALTDCSKLKRIAFPTSLTSVHAEAITGTTSFEDVYYYGGTAEALTALGITTSGTVHCDKMLANGDVAAAMGEVVAKDNGDDKAAGMLTTLENVDDANETINALVWKVTSGGESKKFTQTLSGSIDLAPGAELICGIVVNGVAEMTSTVAVQ